ncbi:hypothetical protein J7Q84_02495 [Bacillus sp. 165]|nr:hypothetical protein [Bacillus sp. 165]
MHETNGEAYHDIDAASLKDVLQLSLEREEEMMRTYLITAERIHEQPELKERLQNFAEGNAKRSRQLIDELKNLT